ncbi:antibiotic biosynthesis monooxygenase family protein [Allorhizocola rhizosphaerae]|uniref:antibiotic biosynthesis monooxygenase family protein n=1 Tax=Allorhizocola rhizosphaerae TaxID=1872709 RepID=UPI000E3BE810|nr:antibiotic biosynthesis monooxygenase family protein [Allorhizocola rhizosphaerae]
MLVLNRFVVASDDDFVSRAHAALKALSEADGYLRGELIRALDDPTHWCLLTEWKNVGSYRRALGRFDVKVTATPLLAESLMEPSAYETLAAAPPGGPIESFTGDLA